MRPPVVAGPFYPGSSAELGQQLDEMMPPVEELPVIGGVVPHAGYVYSGRIAAMVHSRLPKRETYVILGPNHQGKGSLVALSRDSWRTPLGVVRPDIELADLLAGSIIDHDETAHQHEHSIEVQLPFLQRRFGDVRILAISMGMQDEETASEVGEEIARAALKLKRDCTVIASSDFTHYEPRDVARKVDSQLIEAILNMDIPQIYSRAYRYNASSCGIGPIAATIAASRRLGAASGKLLCYGTSGDVSGDYRQVVGYGAIVFT